MLENDKKVGLAGSVQGLGNGQPLGTKTTPSLVVQITITGLLTVLMVAVWAGLNWAGCPLLMVLSGLIHLFAIQWDWRGLMASLTCPVAPAGRQLGPSLHVPLILQDVTQRALM